MTSRLGLVPESHPEVRSRLGAPRVGAGGWLTPDNMAIDSAGPAPGSIDWSLDGLGNWSGDPAAEGSVIWQTGGATTQEIHHVVNSRNEIEELQVNGAGTYFLYDAGGNLVSDGELVYQYDAWGRLLQVNLPGDVQFDMDGRIASGLLGDLKFRYVYDGLGRLIRKETPLTSGTTSLQIKDLYYDGVRRIQEVIFRPDVRDVAVSEEFVTEQGDGSEYVETEAGTNDEAPRTTDENGGEPDAGEQDVNRIGLGQPTGQTWTDREYVYGPGYVDEFVCQIDRNDAVLFMLQDANYNVVGLVAGTGVTDRNGDPVPPGTLLEQYTWEPYGGLAATQSFNAAGLPVIPGLQAVNRVGHQGLFFDRFEGGENDPVLAPGASGLYYNRNRFYSPSLGRFLQRDPNETGLAILTALAMNGEGIKLLASVFSAEGIYWDGLNLYEYLQSNPTAFHDALGLQSAAENLSATGISLLLFAVVGGAVLTLHPSDNGIDLGLTGALGGLADLFLALTAATMEGAHNVANRLGDIIDDIISSGGAKPAKGNPGKCEFYLAWCVWANNRPAGDPGQYWNQNADCAKCYATCKLMNNWPFLVCPMGGPGGPRWPGPNDNWKPGWPTPGEY